MTIDLHQRAAQLLERLGNSIYDRNGNASPLFTFNIKEIHIVEDWLKDLLSEVIEKVS